jgi:hypothetical protein
MPAALLSWRVVYASSSGKLREHPKFVKIKEEKLFAIDNRE